MAAGLLIFPGAQPSRSRQGTVISAELRWYVNETTTPAVVYTDAAMTVPHPFPIISDDAGRFPLIYADSADSFSCNWSTAAPDSQSLSFDFISASTAEDVVLLDEMNAVLSDAMDLYESLADVDAAVEEARGYAAEAATIVAGASGTNSTSTTSLTIGTGTKTLTVDANLLYVPGMNVAIASTTSPSNQMSGPVQSYSAANGALVVATVSTNGSGTFAAWTVSLTGAPYNIASQAEAEAGSDNTKLMTPLRTSQSVTQGKQWALISTTTISGSPTSIPSPDLSAYADVVIEWDNVSFSASLTPTIAISSDGSNYGTARDLTQAADVGFTGEIKLSGTRRVIGSMTSALSIGNITSGNFGTPVAIGAGGYGPAPFRLTGGVKTVRFALTTAGNYSGGTLRFYGR